jgi:hypothetical protein
MCGVSSRSRWPARTDWMADRAGRPRAVPVLNRLSPSRRRPRPAQEIRQLTRPVRNPERGAGSLLPHQFRRDDRGASAGLAPKARIVLSPSLLVPKANDRFPFGVKADYSPHPFLLVEENQGAGSSLAKSQSQMERRVCAVCCAPTVATFLLRAFAIEAALVQALKPATESALSCATEPRRDFKAAKKEAFQDSAE